MSEIDKVLIAHRHCLTTRFIRAAAVQNMLKHEVRPDGTGFVDHPNDPGGATNYGISLRFLSKDGAIDSDGDGFMDGDFDRDGDIDADDIRGLTINQVADLYIKHFWNPHGISQLPPRMAIKVFDMAVNMGPVQAIKLLQRSLNFLNDAGLVEDGKIGPMTIRESKFFTSNWHMEKFMDQIRSQLTEFYVGLAIQRPKLKVFLNGWKKRAMA